MSSRLSDVSERISVLSVIKRICKHEIEKVFLKISKEREKQKVEKDF